MNRSPLPGILIRKRVSILALVLGLWGVIGLGADLSVADPIKRVTGTITAVEEGFLLLKPDNGAPERHFILRWKARFVPAKLPLRGDRAEVLYKDKPEGSVIYGVNYLQPEIRPDD